jgi:Asp-tRNA(Asn)/Glu-tRNA(Gln) amidotransferase A subunit family amidase
VTQDRVKTLLAQLQTELSKAEDLDEETLALAQQLDEDIDALLERQEPNSPEMENAIALEARFAANHPVAERILREIIATLGRIGI